MQRLLWKSWLACSTVQALCIVCAIVLGALGACTLNGDNATSLRIDSQPVSASEAVGTSTAFSVSASGDGLSYQWQTSVDTGSTWADVAGATAATYTIASVEASMNGQQFRVTVTNSTGSVTSSAATLTVTPPTPPAISAQPADQTLVAGATASFSVTATGTALAYLWQSSPDGTAWADLGGATGATLALAAVATTDTGTQYRVVVSNNLGSVTSVAARLTVSAAPPGPVIVTQPQSAGVVAPQTATFNVVAAGTPAPSYQWQQSSDGGATYTDVATATGASYTTAATTVADSGTRLRVRVFNSAGSVLSNAATLSVGTAIAAPVVTLDPVSQAVTVPATATFTFAANGAPTPTYQWQVSVDGGATFTNVTGATGTSFTTSATIAADNGKQFRGVATNSAGSATSSAATLTANSVPIASGAFRCSPFALAAGVSVQSVIDNTTQPAFAGTFVVTAIGPATFEGHNATEVDTTIPLFGAATIDARVFASVNTGTGAHTGFGALSVTRPTVNGSQNYSSGKSVNTPPAVDTEFALAAGQTAPAQSTTAVETTTVTTNGVAGAPTTTTTTSTSPATTFVGFETLTVPAGTFTTCRYAKTSTSGTVTTSWILADYGGVPIQDSRGGVSTSVTVNGVALTHN